MTTLADVLGVFHKWLHLPDPRAVYVTIGTVAANRLPGDPVWLAMVSPPSGGKTEVIASLGRLPDIHPASTITEAALLSGTPKKEHAAGSKGGLLREVGDFGILTVKDFTSVLAMNRDSRSQVLAALREVYDGSWTRHVGTGGGITLHWEGKVGMVAGVTPTIDSAHAVMASMGERLVLYRMPHADDHAQAERAIDNTGMEHHMRAELCEVVASLFDSIEGWHLPLRDLTGEERTELVHLASLAVRCRSSVERDPHSREIELVPASELPGRLAKVLRQLLGGLELIGLGRAEAWSTVAEVAVGCMPAIRRRVLDTMTAGGESMTTSAVAVAIDYPTTTTRRALEDLTAHGVLSREGRGSGHDSQWTVTPWTSAHWPDNRRIPESPASSIDTHIHEGRNFGDSRLAAGEKCCRCASGEVFLTSHAGEPLCRPCVHAVDAEQRAAR